MTIGQEARARPRARGRVLVSHGSWSRAVREFLYGMTAYEFAQQAAESRAAIESLFMLAVFGDMLKHDLDRLRQQPSI